MSSKNDITGDTIATKATSEEYRNNWDAIFGKKKKKLKCVICGATAVKETRTVSTTLDGKPIEPTEITAEWCTECGEAVMDTENATKYSNAIAAHRKPKYTLDELLEQTDPEALKDYDKEFMNAPPVGKEII
jgi:YgiT-type zinc finger domain-containing protein